MHGFAHIVCLFLSTASLSLASSQLHAGACGSSSANTDSKIAILQIRFTLEVSQWIVRERSYRHLTCRQIQVILGTMTMEEERTRGLSPEESLSKFAEYARIFYRA